MKTAAERQDYLVANPPGYRHEIENQQIQLYWAWLLCGLFRLHKFETPIFNGIREEKLQEQTTYVLNGSNGIVWG